MQIPQGREVVDIHEAARQLGFTVEGLRRLCRTKQLLGAAKIGGRWRINIKRARLELDK